MSDTYEFGESVTLTNNGEGDESATTVYVESGTVGEIRGSFVDVDDVLTYIVKFDQEEPFYIIQHVPADQLAPAGSDE